MTVRELVTRLSFKVDKKSLDAAEDKFNKIKKIGRWAAAGIAAGVAAIGIASIKAAGDMEMLTTQFEVMLGSAEKANELMDQLKTFAAGTPFQLQDLAQGTQTLLSFGVAEESVVETMRMLGDTAGGNREKLNGLILAYGKVQTKGKASMEEINMMAERGIPIISVLQQQLGVTEQQFFKMVSAGKIGRNEITKAFRTMTSEGGMFYQGMEKASLTFQGLVSTLKDNLTLMAAEIGSALLPIMKEMITTITRLVQGPLGSLIKELVSGLAPILKMIGPILEMLFSSLEPVLKVLSIFWDLLAEVLKILDVLRPIMKLVAALFDVIARVLEKLQPALKTLIGLIVEMITLFVDLVSTELIKFLEPLGELLGEIASLISEVLIVLMPLIRIVTKFLIGRLVVQLKVAAGILRIITKILTLVIKLIKPIIVLVAKVLTPVFEKLFEFLYKAIGQIQNFFDAVVGFILRGVNKLINWVNKIPGVEIKVPKMPEDLAEKMTKKEIDQSKKVTSVKQTNIFDINAPMGAPGTTGLTPEGVEKSMKMAAKSMFSLELKKVLISSMG